MVVNFDQNKRVDGEFMYYLLRCQDFSALVTGSGQPQIVRTPLAEFSIRFPTDYAEQVAIAQVLRDIDLELESWNQRLQKVLRLKLAMKQQLLTGKTRLK